MKITSLLRILPINRLTISPIQEVRQFQSGAFPLQFKATQELWGMPIKAKKRVDPAIIKAREERKRKKIEKMIRRRLKLDKQLKPIEENEVPEALINNLKERTRHVKVSNDVLDERIQLFKEWSKVKLHESKSDIMMLDRMMYAQEQALNELRMESEELYQAAVKIDEKLIPFTYKGPSETPPSDKYEIPDGEYIDVSKKWV